MGLRPNVRVGGRPLRVAATTAAALLLVVPAAQARARFDASALDHRLRAEPGVLSVLVERDGRLLFERYYRGAARSGRLDVFSVTKSVTATLVGIALHVGMVRSLDQRLGEFFPKDVQHARDKRVRKITLRHLLTMTSGYRDVAAVRSDDWIHTQIDRPLAEDPGRLLFERYYRGAARSGRLDVFSVTKSVTATLVGIALHVGMLRSLDQRAGRVLPQGRAARARQARSEDHAAPPADNDVRLSRRG
ncbi:MAG: hypothetical protein E6G32_12540 [Actinobacteria bacterium]|nr:MAG: hypothetical protein E6G32_12540 [Actinomycetota bacterium]